MGAFGDTARADARNAENVVILDSSEVAGWFLENWHGREAVSRVFGAE